jgi:hypothetical protein
MIDIRTAQGIDASRRVAWAKYYDAQDEIETLRAALVELAELVIFDPRVRNTDEVLVKAQAALSL